MATGCAAAGGVVIGTAPEADAIVQRLGVSRTQAGILASYVELIEELGTDDVSLKLIARRAGVGERTLFRHYGTRTDLLLSAVSWAEYVVFARPTYDSVFDAPVAIRMAMLAYHQRPELTHVVAESMMRGSAGIDSAPSKKQFEALLDREIPDLEADARQNVVMALCHLDSAGTWVAMRRKFGMDAHDVADAASWAAEAVLNPLRSRAVGQ